MFGSLLQTIFFKHRVPMFSVNTVNSISSDFQCFGGQQDQDKDCFACCCDSVNIQTSSQGNDRVQGLRPMKQSSQRSRHAAPMSIFFLNLPNISMSAIDDIKQQQASSKDSKMQQNL